MSQIKYAKLNLPPIKLRARTSQAGVVSVWDSIRGGYIVLTPEEWVRQHIVAFLLQNMSIAPQCVVEEYPVVLNGQNQRADVVVLDRTGSPAILVECKAPEVAISQSTLDQAVRYNSVLGARYLILTNGLSHHLYTCEGGGSYRALRSFDEVVL